MKDVGEILRRIEKAKIEEVRLPIRPSEYNAELRSVTSATLDDPSAVDLLAQWRDEHSEWFPAQFKVTTEGTLRWLRRGVLEAKDRILFWVVDETGNRIGHVGLYRISEDGQACEIDNIVRGVECQPKGLIQHAVVEMLRWQRSHLGIPKSLLRVFSDNDRALRLYQRLGYQERERAPLYRIETDRGVEWREDETSSSTPSGRFFVTMEQVAPC